ncbi:MAG: hypothetical protein KDA81_12295 [Planctomycetaceae bacterium]|nr:hypothetical protein [Planctomycetaceae bacterium]
MNEGHPAHVVAAMIGHSTKGSAGRLRSGDRGHFDAFNGLKSDTTVAM